MGKSNNVFIFGDEEVKLECPEMDDKEYTITFKLTKEAYLKIKSQLKKYKKKEEQSNYDCEDTWFHPFRDDS